MKYLGIIKNIYFFKFLLDLSLSLSLAGSKTPLNFELSGNYQYQLLRIDPYHCHYDTKVLRKLINYSSIPNEITRRYLGPSIHCVIYEINFTLLSNFYKSD